MSNNDKEQKNQIKYFYKNIRNNENINNANGVTFPLNSQNDTDKWKDVTIPNKPTAADATKELLRQKAFILFFSFVLWLVWWRWCARITHAEILPGINDTDRCKQQTNKKKNSNIRCCRSLPSSSIIFAGCGFCGKCVDESSDDVATAIDTYTMYMHVRSVVFS